MRSLTDKIALLNYTLEGHTIEEAAEHFNIPKALAIKVLERAKSEKEKILVHQFFKFIFIHRTVYPFDRKVGHMQPFHCITRRRVGLFIMKWHNKPEFHIFRQ